MALGLCKVSSVTKFLRFLGTTALQRWVELRSVYVMGGGLAIIIGHGKPAPIMGEGGGLDVEGARGMRPPRFRPLFCCGNRPEPLKALGNLRTPRPMPFRFPTRLCLAVSAALAALSVPAVPWTALPSPGGRVTLSAALAAGEHFAFPPAFADEAGNPLAATPLAEEGAGPDAVAVRTSIISRFLTLAPS